MMGEFPYTKNTIHQIPEPDGYMLSPTEGVVRPTREYAEAFIRQCGLNPTPDAVGQLTDAFLPCLKLMCERGYGPDGGTWREKGWRGLVHDILNKAGRLRYRSWRHREFDGDSAIDIINFAGFYYRMKNEGEPWGTWGEPG